MRAVGGRAEAVEPVSGGRTSAGIGPAGVGGRPRSVGGMAVVAGVVGARFVVEKGAGMGVFA